MRRDRQRAAMRRFLLLLTSSILFVSCSKQQGSWVPFTLSADKMEPGAVTQIDLGSIKYEGDKVRFWLRYAIPEAEQSVVPEPALIYRAQVKLCIGRKATAMLAEHQINCSARRITVFDNALLECGQGITVIADPHSPNESETKSETSPALPQYVDTGDWFKYCKKPYEFWK